MPKKSREIKRLALKNATSLKFLLEYYLSGYIETFALKHWMELLFRNTKSFCQDSQNIISQTKPKVKKEKKKPWGVHKC